MPHTERKLTSHPERQQRLRHPSDSSSEVSISDRGDHPLLRLQRTAGNRAVQRLVNNRGGDTPTVIQRVLSPSTAAMGQAGTSSLLSQWAGVHIGATTLQQSAAILAAQVQAMLNPITQVQAALVIAEQEPAPASGPPVPATGGV